MALEKMPSHDWFRNIDWNAAIRGKMSREISPRPRQFSVSAYSGELFGAKHPKAALELLDRYFAMGEHFDIAQALFDQAVVYVALGQIDDGIRSLQKARHDELRPRESPFGATLANDGRSRSIQWLDTMS
ncbi:MAG: hypothetical protein WB723_16560 [Candidatus Acidiferrales bacterium]